MEVKQWITVHPNGADNKGQPIPVMEGQSKGEAVKSFVSKHQKEVDALKNKSTDELKRVAAQKEIPNILYDQWREYADKAEEGKAKTFNDPSNWIKYTSLGNDFEGVNEKISEMAFDLYNDGTLNYNAYSNKASKLLNNGARLVLTGVSNNHGMVTVETINKFKTLDIVSFNSWKDAYDYAKLQT